MVAPKKRKSSEGAKEIAHMLKLTPAERLKGIAANGVCVCCQKRYKVLHPAGERIESMLHTLAFPQMEKGCLKVCTDCKNVLVQSREVLLNISLVKNVVSADGRAEQYLSDLKELKRMWFCRTCGEAKVYIEHHLKSCKPRNTGGTENNETSPYFPASNKNTRQNITIIGQHPKSLKIQGKRRVTFGADPVPSTSREEAENQDGLYQQNMQAISESQNREVGTDRQATNTQQAPTTITPNKQASQANKQTESIDCGQQGRDIDRQVPIKCEFLPTQDAQITSIIDLCDDDDYTETANVNITPKKQARIDEYFTRNSRASRDEAISSTSPEASNLTRNVPTGNPNVLASPPDVPALSLNVAAPSPDVPAPTANVPAPSPDVPTSPQLLKQQEHQCDHCGQTFDSFRGYKLHSATKGRKCQSCDEIFCTGQQLAEHRRARHPRRSRVFTAHEERPAECLCCKRVFPNPLALSKHRHVMGPCHGGVQGLMDLQCPCGNAYRPSKIRRMSAYRSCAAEEPDSQETEAATDMPSTSVVGGGQQQQQRETTPPPPSSHVEPDEDTQELIPYESATIKSEQDIYDEFEVDVEYDSVAEEEQAVAKTPPEALRARAIFQRTPSISEQFNPQAAIQGLNSLMDHHRRLSTAPNSTGGDYNTVTEALTVVKTMYEVLRTVFERNGGRNSSL